MSEVFHASEYLIRRQFFTLWGAKFRIYDADGQLLGFSKQKAFKLKEDIRIFTDESMEEELLLIKARKIVDFSAAYDVIDSAEGEKIGALRRKGWSSLVRDEWEFLDEEDYVIGHIHEDSMAWALVRRFILNLIPQTYHAKADDEVLATYRTHFNPFVHKLSVTIEEDADERFDTRLLLAGGILLVAIEGRQG